MFLADMLDPVPYRFPPEWGIHSLAESDHGDSIRSLSDYLWTTVGGLQEPRFGDTQQGKDLAKKDAKLGYWLRGLAECLLAIPDAEWESWARKHVPQLG